MKRVATAAFKNSGIGKARRNRGRRMTNSRDNNNKPTVLVVGSGLTGSICCYKIRSLLPNVRLEVADMARGAGGRMSTTRQTIHQIEVKANTGAQYASCASDEIHDTLKKVCDSSDKDHILKIIPTPSPTERSLHFPLVQDPATSPPQSVDDYTHYEIAGGTNNLVKQFLYAGRPDVVSFETRLTKLWKDPNTGKIIPQFDLRGNNIKNNNKKGNKQNTTKNQNTSSSSSLSEEFDAVVLALPPKDAVKFFQPQQQNGNNNRNNNNNNRNRHDPQSQADLHRRFHKRNQHNANNNTANLDPLRLDGRTNSLLRKVQYIGRYSLTLWFNNAKGKQFAKTAFDKWQSGYNQQQDDNHSLVLDAILLQEEGQVLVIQSTVQLWRKYSGVSAGGGRGGGKQRQGKSAGRSLQEISGGGRQAVRTVLTQALESVAGNQKLPPVAHAKLLNWRTSQVVKTPFENQEDVVVTTENGRVVLTGDWCTESSLEGCYRAAAAAAKSIGKGLGR